MLVQNLIDPVWEQQPNEPQSWFDRFDKYARPLGTDFTPKRAYTIYRVELARKGDILVNNDASFEFWVMASTEWKWEERARAWAAEDRKMYELMWQMRRREVIEEDFLMGDALRSFSRKVLARMAIHEVVGEDEEGNKLIKVAVRPNELAAMVKISSDLQRLSVGEPTVLAGNAQASVSFYLPENKRPVGGQNEQSNPSSGGTSEGSSGPGGTE